MIVRVTLTIEVDRDAWADLYGPGPRMTASEIREDVRQYVSSEASMSPAADEGAILRVERR